MDIEVLLPLGPLVIGNESGQDRHPGLMTRRREIR